MVRHGSVSADSIRWGLLGARAGVRIAGAERHPFRHLAPLAGVRGLAPDVRGPTRGRLIEGWRAYVATAAPALVIGGRTRTVTWVNPGYFGRRTRYTMNSTAAEAQRMAAMARRPAWMSMGSMAER